jgi:hypothetical protein
MTDIRSLERTLLDNLPWNKARIKFVARFLLALYAMRTVNLSILTTAFSGFAKEESNTNERITVMEIFLDLLGAQNVAWVLGDREFVGSEWFCFLKSNRIKFQMRLHRDTLVRNGRGQYVQACPPKCIFRRGLNILCRLVANFERVDVAVWRKVIKLLSCS